MDCANKKCVDYEFCKDSPIYDRTKCIEFKSYKHEKIMALIEECKKLPPDINAKLDEIKQLIRGE